MILNIYSIFDECAGRYLRPWYSITDNEALRAFTDIAMDPGEDVGKHPEHYTLFKIGVYDDETGNITADVVKFMATALERKAFAQQFVAEQLANIAEGTNGTHLGDNNA